MHEWHAAHWRATVNRTGGVGSTRNPFIFSIIAALPPLRPALPTRSIANDWPSELILKIGYTYH
jgi:hypothetical protein